MTRPSSHTGVSKAGLRAKSPRPRGGGGRTPGAFVNHEAALAYLDGMVNVERVRPEKVSSEVWKLDRMRALMGELGDPQDELDIVHIAGSKGKGSVCNMLECSLNACGYTTGVFTSPHLMDVRERIRISNHAISEALFDQGLAICRDAALRIEDEHGRVTYFELITAAALVVFAQQAVDLVVLETGLGGRLDCTNIVSPRVVGLTNIQLEHTQILGDTLEKIAAEKAGIIKPGVVAITTPQEAGVLGVFRERAAAAGGTLKVLGDEVLYTQRFQSGVTKGPHARVCVGEERDGFEHMSVPLMGMHQAENCGLALAIIIELRSFGFDLPERMVTAGLERVNRQGRLEQIMDKPRIVIDGAHTPASVRMALKAVSAHLEFDSLIVIFGCAGDKDIDGMLAELDRGADKVIFTRASNNPRAVDPGELLVRFTERCDAMADAKGTLRESINDAARAVRGNDMILVIGSFYLAGEAKMLVESRAAQR